jgi:hypothetical protein
MVPKAPLVGADHQDVRAAASLAMPLEGHAGFAGVAVCFRARPSALLTWGVCVHAARRA